MKKYKKTNSLGLTIVVTMECNFACPYCYERGINPQFMSREVEDKIIDYVNKNVKENGALNIYHGTGASHYLHLIQYTDFRMLSLKSHPTKKCSTELRW